MHALRRHQLAYLNAKGWQRLLGAAADPAPDLPAACGAIAAPGQPVAWDAEARSGLAHWAAAGLPLVVARQRLARHNPEDPVSLGLCLPAQWNRRRLALQVPWADIALFSEFPPLTDVAGLLPRRCRSLLRTCAAQLHRHGLRARVYGSAGWQCITGLPYLHDRSDLDLWVAVDSDAEADAAAAVLARCEPPRLRVDGELVFTDGSAAAWREWRQWQAGACNSLLVKRLDGVDLLQRPGRTPRGMLAVPAEALGKVAS